MRTLETPRLRLRDWAQADAADLFAYASLPAVAEQAGWAPHKTPAESRAFIRELYAGRCYALALRESGRVIGGAGVYDTAPCRAFRALCGRELGFNLHPAYWGQGLMSEALSALIAALFDRHDPLCPPLSRPVDFLLLSHFPGNARCAQLALRLGFRPLFDRAARAVPGEPPRKPERFYLLLNPAVFGRRTQQAGRNQT